MKNQSGKGLLNLCEERKKLLSRVNFVEVSHKGLNASRVDISTLRCSVDTIEAELEVLSHETEEKESIARKTQDQLEKIFDHLSEQSKLPLGSVESDISPLTAEAVDWVSSQLKTEKELEQLQKSLMSAMKSNFDLYTKSSVISVTDKERAEEFIRKIDPLLQELEGVQLDEGGNDDIALKRRHLACGSGLDPLQDILSTLVEVRRSSR